MRAMSKLGGIAESGAGYFAKSMRNLWSLLKGQRKAVLTVVFWIVVIRSIDLSFPFLFKLFVNLKPGTEVTYWSNAVICLFWVMAGLTVVNILFRFFKEVRAQKILIFLENHFPVIAHAKLLALSLDYHNHNNTGAKIARIDNGSKTLVNVVGDTMSALVGQFMFLVLNIGLILFMDWRLGLIFLLPFIPAGYINYLSYVKFGPIWDKIQSKKEQASDIFCQSIIGVFTVKIYGQEEVSNLEYARMRGEIKDIDIKTIKRLQYYQSAVSGILYLFFYVTLWFCFDFVLKSKVDLGTVVYIYSTGATTFNTLSMFIYIYARVLKNLVAVNRMKDLLDEPEENLIGPDVTVPKEFHGRFDLEKVDFSYYNKETGKSAAILRGLDMTIEAGKTTAIAGATGVGKTTLLNLLFRMYEPDGGLVRLDGTDIGRIDRPWYLSHFAVVLQNPFIFDRSIDDNITFACRYIDGWSRKIICSATKGERDMALRIANIEEAKHFPDGIDTIVGERGARLSGGQRQRLELARAILVIMKGAKVLVLDEPTSQLDPKTEEAIQINLKILRERYFFTKIVVAHRLATIRDADTIYILSGGKVAEKGTHSGLLSQKGLYYGMAKQQLSRE